jgi:hypothetical protein
VQAGLRAVGDAAATKSPVMRQFGNIWWFPGENLSLEGISPAYFQPVFDSPARSPFGAQPPSPHPMIRKACGHPRSQQCWL